MKINFVLSVLFLRISSKTPISISSFLRQLPENRLKNATKIFFSLIITFHFPVFLELLHFCSILFRPSNGQINSSDRSIGSIVSFSCDIGFVLASNATRKCQSNTIWSRSNPNCEGIFFLSFGGWNWFFEETETDIDRPFDRFHTTITFSYTPRTFPQHDILVLLRHIQFKRAPTHIPKSCKLTQFFQFFSMRYQTLNINCNFLPSFLRRAVCWTFAACCQCLLISRLVDTPTIWLHNNESRCKLSLDVMTRPISISDFLIDIHSGMHSLTPDHADPGIHTHAHTHSSRFSRSGIAPTRTLTHTPAPRRLWHTLTHTHSPRRLWHTHTHSPAISACSLTRRFMHAPTPAPLQAWLLLLPNSNSLFRRADPDTRPHAHSLTLSSWLCHTLTHPRSHTLSHRLWHTLTRTLMHTVTLPLTLCTHPRTPYIKAQKIVSNGSVV